MNRKITNNKYNLDKNIFDLDKINTVTIIDIITTKKQNKEYESKLFSSYELIGNSKNIVNIIDQIKKISVTESRVFISGPSGSGKELIARKIHKNSKRNKKPFVILNGALLDNKKYELELFGEEKSMWCDFKGSKKRFNFK